LLLVLCSGALVITSESVQQQCGLSLHMDGASLTRLPATLPKRLQHLRIAAQVGYGAFAQVVEVHDASNPRRRCALKIVEKEPLAIRGMLPQLACEFGMQLSVRHPHVLCALDMAEDATHGYLLLELCTGGSLWLAAQHFPGSTVPEATTSCWLQDATDGAAHLHDMGILHRDLKLENMLLDAAGRVKLCDLGWCAFEADEPRGRCGTPQHLPPEALRGEAHTAKFDSWALGASMVQLLSGRGFVGPQELNLPGGTSAAAQELIAAWLKFDPIDRLSAKAALSSPFFRHTAGAASAWIPNIPEAALDSRLEDERCTGYLFNVAFETARRLLTAKEGKPWWLAERPTTESRPSVCSRPSVGRPSAALRTSLTVHTPADDRFQTPGKHGLANRDRTNKARHDIEVRLEELTAAAREAKALAREALQRIDACRLAFSEGRTAPVALLPTPCRQWRR